MPRQVIVENVFQGEAAPSSPPPRFDARDAVLVLGAVLTLAGVWLIHRPTAIILGGILCFAYALASERAEGPEHRTKRRHGNPHS